MVSLFEDGAWLIPDQRCLTCRKTLSLSSGAVPVLDTDPATAPAISCRHTNPDCFSFSENSSGTVKSSPMSNIYTNTQQWCYRKTGATQCIAMTTSVSASYHRVFPILSDFLHVVQRVKQEVISPLEPVDGHGMVFIHTIPTHFTSQIFTPEKHFTHMLSTKRHTFAGFWRPAPAWRPRRDCVTTAGSPRRPAHLQNTQGVSVLKYEIIDLKTELMELMLMLIWGIDANSDVAVLTLIL